MITIVTLYDDKLCEHYVGAVQGKISSEDRQRLAVRFDANDWVEGSEPGEDERVLYFVEMETCEDMESLHDLKNISGEGD